MILQDLLGIELPIIQAPMAGVQGSTLAVAVSNAGGLGSLPCAMLGRDAMRQELTAIRSQTTKPFSTQLGTFALVPQMVRAIKIPVIAAGGIADAKGVAAAMALGAAGVQVGTSYMLCPEATTSAVHRAALKSDAAHLTAVTNVFSGRPARGIVNRIVRELGPINVIVPKFPLAASAIASLRAKAESMGIGDFSPLGAGQNTSGCRETSAFLLTRELADTR